MPKHKFQKGIAYNPKGRPKLSPEYHMTKIIHRDEVKAIFSKYLAMDVDKLLNLVGTSMPAIDAIVVGIIAKAAEDGDFTRLNFLLDRMHGKVKEQIEVSKNYNEMTDAELLLEAKKAVNEFESTIEAKYKEV